MLEEIGNFRKGGDTVKTKLARLGLSLALASSFALAATSAFADDYRDACHKRLENAKAKLDHDAARHGPDSPQVDHDRAKLEDARQWCRDHHADWDHSQFDVGIYLRK
jgi:hypothetical protein